MSNTAIRQPRMTVPEFLAWSARQPDEDRYELVDGEIVAMTRDTVGHNRAKAAAWRALDDAVRAAGLPCFVFVDGVAVAVGERTLRIPDAAVQCGPEPDADALILNQPLIVVEVVSPSSERDDIETKLIDYFAVPSIRHYLIVIPKERALVHHSRGEGGAIATRIHREGVVTLDPPGIDVLVAALLAPGFSGQEGNG